MRDELAHITSDNCHYVFAAGSFLLVSGFGELALRRGVDTTPQDLVDVFLLVRGMTFVVSLWGDTIHNGPFFDLFQMRDRHQGSEFHADMDRSLARLRIDLQSVVSDRSIGDVLDKEVANLAEQLEKAVVNAPVPELRVLMTWPGVMSDTYIQLLRSESPGAMVILAYYCVLAHRARADNWYTRTWGSAVLDSIQENLPPKWKPLIQWPVDYVQGERQPHSATHDRRAQT